MWTKAYRGDDSGDPLLDCCLPLAIQYFGDARTDGPDRCLTWLEIVHDYVRSFVRNGYPNFVISVSSTNENQRATTVRHHTSRKFL
jgi:hypothetical protein